MSRTQGGVERNRLLPAYIFRYFHDTQIIALNTIKADKVKAKIAYKSRLVLQGKYISQLERTNTTGIICKKTKLTATKFFLFGKHLKNRNKLIQTNSNAISKMGYGEIVLSKLQPYTSDESTVNSIDNIIFTD